MRINRRWEKEEKKDGVPEGINDDTAAGIAAVAATPPAAYDLAVSATDPVVVLPLAVVPVPVVVFEVAGAAKSPVTIR